MSEPDQPTPGPGDADTTQVQPATFSTPAAFSTPIPPPDPPAAEIPGAGGASPVDKAAQVAEDRPEVAVGAAFAGGLVFAMLLKRLGH